jgi:dihydroorotase
MLLKDCKIIDSRGMVRGDILMEGETIKEIKKDIAPRGEETMNLKGAVVIPGLVDCHVHMRDFEEKKKETFRTGSRAALAGGVTTFLDMPNSNPPVVDGETFARRVEAASRQSLCDFGINYGLTGESLDRMGQARPASLKVYMDGGLGPVDQDTMKRAVESGWRVAFHAEDGEMIRRNLEYLKGEEKGDFLLHGDLREPKAELWAVKTVCQLSKVMERPVHICHISYRKSLPLLGDLQTWEVTPHHLLLTETDLKNLKGFAKTNPPLRSPLDIQALWGALKAGKVPMIASDHAPHTLAEKEAGPLEAPSGIPGLDTMLRLLLTLVSKRTLTLQEVVRLASENPARIFGLKAKGRIAPGMDADILVLDMKEEGKIDVDEFHSKAKYSPFEGWKTVGSVRKVFLRGRLAYDDEDFLVRPGYGRFIPGEKRA